MCACVRASLMCVSQPVFHILYLRVYFSLSPTVLGCLLKMATFGSFLPGIQLAGGRVQKIQAAL